MNGHGYYKFKKFSINTAIHIFLILISASCLFPLLWMVGSSLKTQTSVFSDMSLFPKVMHWENYVSAWVSGGFEKYLLNSLIYTLIVVTGIVIVSSLAAYAFSRLKFPGRNFLFYMFLAAMMIPLPGSFVALYVLVNKVRSLLFNFLTEASPVLLKFFPQSFVYSLTEFIKNQFYPRSAYILCMVNVGLSFSIYLLKTFFDRMPKELEDAARIDGCSRLGIWWNVAFPLARPAIAVVVIFNTLAVWNEYILALIIFDSRKLMPLQTGLTTFMGEHLTQYPLLMAGTTISVLPIILVYLFFQKYIIKGITAGALVE